MEDNFYMTNRQKLLFMVQELHKRGFGKLRIVPYIAPSGMYWRCDFINEAKTQRTLASNWINNHENENSSEEIKLTTQELADLFIKENAEFIGHCKGMNEEYVKWYSEMLLKLKKSELPYAFDDYTLTKGFWETSENNKIETLPNEEKYYF